MSNQEPQFPFSSEEQQQLERRSAFMGLIDFTGIDIIQDILVTGRKQEEMGYKGITVPSDDGTMWITAGDKWISFMIDAVGPYMISVEEAQTLIAEKAAEKQQN